MCCDELCTWARVHILIWLPLFSHAQAGLTQYPDSTLIRTQYSLFLATYKGNAQRATAVLMSVSSLSPMVDLRFQMFTSSRILGKLRRGDQKGGAMDALGEMSFQRHHNQALSRHTEAVSTMHKLWKALERFDKVQAAVLHLLQLLLLSTHPCLLCSTLRMYHRWRHT